MKKAVRLIVGQFDNHMLSQLKSMVKEEVNDRLREIREARRQRSNSTIKSEKSYNRFNGIRPPSHLSTKHNKMDSVQSLSPNSNLSNTKDIISIQKVRVESEEFAMD